VSKFIDLYREKKSIQRRLRKIRKKADPKEYWALKAEEKEIDQKLNQIIADDNASRIEKRAS